MHRQTKKPFTTRLHDSLAIFQKPSADCNFITVEQLRQLLTILGDTPFEPVEQPK